jgi:hypothetical protein
MRWIVEDVPAWVVGLVLIVGLPVAAMLLKAIIGRRVKSLSTPEHNEVAGFLVAIVAVVYAVLVGFTIVSLYEASVAASSDVSEEAADLLQLHQGNAVFGPAASAAINVDITRYAEAVVLDWKAISYGNASPEAQVALEDIYSTLDAYTPHSAASADYLNQSIQDLGSLSKARAQRQLEARESGSLPLVLWVVLIITSLVTLGFALLFSLENRRIAYVMVAAVTAVVSANIFVLVELGYPFAGSVSVGPDKFEAVIHIIGG